MDDRPPARRTPHVLFAVYVALCLLCSVWPGYSLLGAHVEPRILGLPFAFAWTIGWVIATFIAMVLYHRATQR